MDGRLVRQIQPKTMNNNKKLQKKIDFGCSYFPSKSNSKKLICKESVSFL